MNRRVPMGAPIGTLTRGVCMRKFILVTGCMLSLMMAAPMMNNQVVDSVIGIETAYAAESTFSEYWFQDADGSWKVRDSSGGIVKNAWLCDDAVSSNGQNVWYLLDANGNMITSGLVQDGTGNYYSIETNHNGFYGMLRYQSGNYDGINLSLDSNHSGSFAAIQNAEGLESLKTKYGVTQVSISNSNCVYTSSFRASGGTGGNSGSSNVDTPSSNNNTSNQNNDTSNKKKTSNRFDDSNQPAGMFDNDIHLKG